MRCNICDKVLDEQEIQLAPDGKTFEPCSYCLEIAMEAAYCDGFVKEENEEDEDGEIDTLELESFRTCFDHCDPGFTPERYEE